MCERSFMAAILKSTFKAIDKDGIGTAHTSQSYGTYDTTRITVYHKQLAQHWVWVCVCVCVCGTRLVLYNVNNMYDDIRMMYRLPPMLLSNHMKN